MLSTPKSPGSGEKTDEQTDTQTTVRCGKGYKRCRVQTGRGVDGLRGLCTRGQDGSQAEQTRRETGFRAERTAAPAVVAHAGPCGGVSSIPTGLQGLKRLCWDGLLLWGPELPSQGQRNPTSSRHPLSPSPARPHHCRGLGRSAWGERASNGTEACHRPGGRFQSERVCILYSSHLIRGGVFFLKRLLG